MDPNAELVPPTLGNCGDPVALIAQAIVFWWRIVDRQGDSVGVAVGLHHLIQFGRVRAIWCKTQFVVSVPLASESDLSWCTGSNARRKYLSDPVT